MKPEVMPDSTNIEQQLARELPNLERGYSVENLQNNSKEVINSSGEKSELGAATNDVGLTTVIPVPVVADDNVVADTTIIDAPSVANDDDLIEKEWVDKAKKIVSSTREDPYQQEEAVSKLQIDYLKKRYGRELGVTK